MQMGTGKTLTAIRLMESKQDLKNVLVLAPKSTLKNFASEVEKWAEKDGINWHYLGYESLGHATGTIDGRPPIEALANGKWGLIMDESIYLKNPDTKRTRHTRHLARFCEYKLLLNGTPTATSILDLKSQLDVLDHKILSMSDDEFALTFCEIKAKKLADRKAIAIKMKTHEPNTDKLMEALTPWVFNASLDLAVQCNEITDEFATTDEEHRAILDGVKDAIQKASFSQGDPDKVAILTAHRLNSLAKSRAEKVAEIFDNVPGNAVIFCNFIAEGEAIAEAIGAGKTYFLHGDTEDKKREQYVKSWTNSDHRALILTYGVGAFGLNLQTNCNTCILSSRSMSYVIHKQALARVYRQGQANDVNLHIVKSNEKAEKISDVIHNNKLKLSKQVLKNLVKIIEKP